MGTFTYGIGSDAVNVNVDDWFLEVFEEALAAAYKLRSPFRIRVSDDKRETVLFVTDGVPLRIRYDSSQRPDADERSQKMYASLRKQLDSNGELGIHEPAEKKRPSPTVYTGSSTAR